MAQHYLLYWKFQTVQYHYFGGALETLMSSRFRLVKPYDTVWIVTLRGGDLLLVGCVKVGSVSPHPIHVPDSTRKHQQWLVEAQSGTTEPMSLINLTELHVTLSLRFKSRADRLRINQQGRLHAVSLYPLRQLTDDSVALLVYVWEDRFRLWNALEEIETEPDPEWYVEGNTVSRIQAIKQRNSKLIHQAKKRHLEQEGDLACEVCGMSFEAQYGEIGQGYIEAHHRKPMAEMAGETFSEVEDIMLLCSNCHRMIHRQSPPFTVEELKSRVEAQRSKLIRRNQDERNNHTTSN